MPSSTSQFDLKIIFLGLLGGLFFLCPKTLAAPAIEFSPTPDSQYKLYEGQDYEVSVKLSDYAFTTKIDLHLVGPLNEDRIINSYEYTGNGVHEFIWDGKIDGNYAPPGSYKMILTGGDICLYEANILTHDFTVLSQSIVENTNTNSPVDSDGDLVFQTDLKTADNACVELRINDESVKTFQNLQSGGQQLKLNLGELNLEPGEHEWALFINGPACGGSTNQEQKLDEGTFKVNDPVEEENFTTLCGDFVDISPDHPDCPAIGYVKSIGAMTGFPDGTFRPDAILQRDQIAKISLETFNLFEEGTDYCKGQPAYPDVPSSQWSYQYVCRGTQLGMITGYEGGEDKGKYVPERLVNRVEFLALILRNLSDVMPPLNTPSYQDVSIGQWYSGFSAYAFNHGLFTGAQLYPNQEVSRVEVARTLYKLFQLGKI